MRLSDEEANREDWVVACTALDGSACASEGLGHEKSITCLAWLPGPTDKPINPTDQRRKGRLYHLVTGSKDGELRQW